MTIEEAVKALTEGKKIRRKDWEKDNYITLVDNQVVSQNGWSSGLCIDNFSADWWEEYKEDILDEEEKKYLSAVIKPFRDRVHYICKIKITNSDNQFIFIRVKRYDCEEDEPKNTKYEDIDLPYFKKDTMYKGMETDKKYTLEELGLWNYLKH